MARPLRIENRRIEMAHIASGSGLYFTLCPFLYPSPFASKYKLTPFARNSAKYKPDPVRSPACLRLKKFFARYGGDYEAAIAAASRTRRRR